MPEHAIPDVWYEERCCEAVARPHECFLPSEEHPPEHECRCGRTWPAQ